MTCADFLVAGRNFLVVSFVHSKGCMSTCTRPEALPSNSPNL
jgi:hypothetical protein